MNNGELSILFLISEASLLVQLVMLVLVLASVGSWAVMIRTLLNSLMPPP